MQKNMVEWLDTAENRGSVLGMSYRIMKNGTYVASAERITFNNGVLECRSEFGGRVRAYYAPGSWELAYWEEEEN